ncbi:MAG: bacillithiol system redox-active protein YtxJ [Chitinophagaceae bacterium]
MNWLPLQEASQVEHIIENSFKQPQVIFKHSTRCSISDVAKSRLERNPFPETIAFHYLNLIAYRELSNLIAETFQIQHESPQVLLIKNGKCTYHESHMAIDFNDIVTTALSA